MTLGKFIIIVIKGDILNLVDFPSFLTFMKLVELHSLDCGATSLHQVVELPMLCLGGKLNFGMYSLNALNCVYSFT